MKNHLLMSIVVAVTVVGCSTPTPHVATPPRVIYQVKPIYPADLIQRGIEGEVRVGFIVDVQGIPRDAYVQRSTRREFEAPALAAVQEWRFEPGTVDGKPVNTRMVVPVVFRFEETVPNKSSQSTTPAVTPPAGQEARQP